MLFPIFKILRRGKVFISYRREGGADLARLIKSGLESLRYFTYMDVENLRSGPFNTALLREIETATDVIVVLTPGSLDRCREEGDWLRREVAHAIDKEKNVVPVIARGFKWPSTHEIPSDMASLRDYQGITPSHELFDASIKKLATLLHARSRFSPQGKVLLIVACVVLLLAAAFPLMPSKVGSGNSVAERDAAMGPPKVEKMESVSREPQMSQDETLLWKKIINFRARDGGRNLLTVLYGTAFDINNAQHQRILQNISKQIISRDNGSGTALDIDTLKLVSGVPLVCRDVNDLEAMLQNQLEIYERGKETIKRIFDLDPNATFASNAFLRQAVVDYESKIHTSFRTLGPKVNIKTGARDMAPLLDNSSEEILDKIRNLSLVMEKLKVPPGPRPDTRHLDPAFYPVGGYNIIG